MLICSQDTRNNFVDFWWLIKNRSKGFTFNSKDGIIQFSILFSPLQVKYSKKNSYIKMIKIVELYFHHLK